MTINNNSDLGVTCGQCGGVFSGKSMYAQKISQMYINHCESLHQDKDTYADGYKQGQIDMKDIMEKS